VKNGGSHFFAEIASREFMDNLVSILEAHGGAAPNDEVKSKVLELIQSWSQGAESKPNAGYIVEIYRTLQRQGFQFPPVEHVASSMYESNAVRLKETSKTLNTANYSPHSHLSGSIRTCVCGAGRSSHSQTGNITVEIAETSSAVRVQARQFHYHTLVSCSP